MRLHQFTRFIHELHARCARRSLSVYYPRMYNYVLLNISHANVRHDRFTCWEEWHHSRKINVYFSGERYTPNHSDQWHEISEMFSPRSNFATVILDDMIFVIGGYNGTLKKEKKKKKTENYFNPSVLLRFIISSKRKPRKKYVCLPAMFLSL